MDDILNVWIVESGGGREYLEERRLRFGEGQYRKDIKVFEPLLRRKGELFLHSIYLDCVLTCLIPFRSGNGTSKSELGAQGEVIEAG